MENHFFDHPILNPPYERPERHWELDEAGQPTQKILSQRRAVDFITPIPKAKKRKGKGDQQELVLPAVSKHLKNVFDTGEEQKGVKAIILAVDSPFVSIGFHS